MVGAVMSGAPDLRAPGRWVQRRRVLFPAIEMVRELKDPLRSRTRLVRRSLELGPLKPAGRATAQAHPIAMLAKLFGAGNRRGPVWAVSVVRNEELRIGGSIQTLLDGGVDAVVVADNLSTDRTRDFLDHLASSLPIVVLRDLEHGHYQSQKVSRLA